MTSPRGRSALWRLLGRRGVLFVQDFSVASAVLRSLVRSTEYGHRGSELSRLENSLSLTLDGIPVVGLDSGSDALVLALKVLGVGVGDEVIVPAFGCAVLASSALWVNAQPVFADVRKDDYGIDPDAVEKKITGRTKAVIVAHLFGQPTGGMEKIMQIARRHNLVVIEDAAQAFGAHIHIAGEWRGVGTLGDVGCFSFTFGKPFTGAGKGGALVVKDKRLQERALQIRSYGAKEAYINYPEVGINMKLDDIHASILIAKLPFYTYVQEHQEMLARRYRQNLSTIKEILLPQEGGNSKRIWHRYVVRAKDRDRLLAFLKNSFRSRPRLRAFIPYPVLLPSFLLFGGAHMNEIFSVTEEILKEIISLPLADTLSLVDIDLVCKLITDFYRQNKWEK